MKLFCYLLLFCAGIAELHAQTNNQSLADMLKTKGPAATWQYAIEHEREFDLKQLRNICMYVGSREKEEGATGRYAWEYQRKIIAAAKVDTLKDNANIISQKISRMWNKYGDLLVCSNLQFDVSNGSVIKYAVNTMFDAFLRDMILWNVNLNKIDEADGMTILDYIQQRIEKSKGQGTEQQLKNY